jgi:hypothetical protein
MLNGCRYISTPLMSPAVKETVTRQLKAQGSEWAHIEDAVKAVARIATDNSINGWYPHMLIEYQC